MFDPKEDPIITLYREAFPHFARMVRTLGGTPEEAKDCFHDALLIYLERERAGKLKLHSSPTAYLLGTGKICWLQKRSRGSFSPLPEGFDSSEAPEPDLEEREQSLLASLERTGRKCLQLLKSFYYDHLSMDDIAARFGFNGRRSATVQKYKCLEKVRENLKTTEAYAE